MLRFYISFSSIRMKGYLSESLHLLGDEKRKLPLMIVLFVIVSLLDIGNDAMKGMDRSLYRTCG